jgi:choline dehydrogenase-like flavoprotein
MASIIIVGGSLAGTVLCSRLHHRRPALSIVLIEAGPDASAHAHVTHAADGAKLHLSALDYAFMTAPQGGLDGREKYNCAVRALGGGTTVNYGERGVSLLWWCRIGG